MKKLALSIASALAVSAPSFAEGECLNELVTTVTVHSVGSIFFTSTKSCAAWCQIGSNYSADSKRHMLALLLTAKENQTPVNIAWSSLGANTATCPTQPGSLPQPVYIRGN